MENKPRYAFFGSPEFAAIVLAKLIDAELPPTIIICNPDRPVGRKQIITAPAVKIEVRKKNLESRIEILQPEKPSEVKDKLAALNLDFAVVAAYSQILRKDILAIPRLGIIGVHPSLLPKYRGATPIQSTILNGETETGVTLYKMGEGVDDGPILATSDNIQITSDETYETLHNKLAEIGGNLLVKIIPSFIAGIIRPQPQNNANATLTKKFETQDGFVDPVILRQAQDGDLEKAKEINRRVRALNPEPGIWTVLNNKRTKILEVDVIDGRLKLKKIQADGGKPQELP